MQLTHYTTNFIKRAFPITLVCDNVTNRSNIGSLFRIADAFGIEQLIFCGDTIPMGPKITKTARATEKVVNFKVDSNISEVVNDLKSKGHFIVSLEITDQSLPLHTFQFSESRPIVLIVGDENFGISETILKQSDAVVHIEMFGHNSSMNVVQAANICLYEITKQLL